MFPLRVWQSLVAGFKNASARRSGKPKPLKPRRCSFEGLEPRQLLSITPTFSAGLLSVLGNSENDTIAVGTMLVGTVEQVTVNGQLVGTGIAAADVQNILIDGGAGNDSINLGSLDLTKFTALRPMSVELRGGAGNDTLVGTALADRLDGGAGNDILTGNAGDDTLIGGTGSDKFLFAGSSDLGSDSIVEAANRDNDTLDFAALGAGATIDLGLTTPQTIANGLLELVLSDGAGVENVTGTAYADVLTGNDRANTLTGNNGDDLLVGLDGNDTLNGGNGNDTLDAGLGNDKLDGGAGNDTLLGGEGSDRLVGGAGNDALDGGLDSDEYVFSGSGNLGSDTLADAGGAADYISFAKLAGTVNFDRNRVGVQQITPKLALTVDVTTEIEGLVANASGDATQDDFVVPGESGETTVVVFTLGACEAGYYNTLYVRDRQTAQEFELFTNHKDEVDAVIALPFEAGHHLTFRLAQNAADPAVAQRGSRSFFADPAQNEGGRDQLRAWLDANPSGGTSRALYAFEDLAPGSVANPRGLHDDADYDDMVVMVAELPKVGITGDLDAIGGSAGDTIAFQIAIDAPATTVPLTVRFQISWGNSANRTLDPSDFLPFDANHPELGIFPPHVRPVNDTTDQYEVTISPGNRASDPIVLKAKRDGDAPESAEVEIRPDPAAPQTYVVTKEWFTLFGGGMSETKAGPFGNLVVIDQATRFGEKNDTKELADANADSGVDMNDLRQGYVGNCSVVATLVALVRDNPDWIKSHTAETVAPAGDKTFTVTLYDIKTDKWRDMSYDTSRDQILCFGEQAQRVTGDYHSDNDGRADDGYEIWPQLYERAYREIRTWPIADGPVSAWRILTGKTSECRDVKTNDDVWNAVGTALENGNQAVLVSRESIPNSLLQKYNPSDSAPELAGPHGFVLIGRDTEKQTLRVYNAWGWQPPSEQYPKGRDGYLDIAKADLADIFVNLTELPTTRT